MLRSLYEADVVEAGCDEAGRGPLAGPLFAAAVILPSDFFHPLLDDSKRMTERNRDLLRQVIEREAVAWTVAELPPERIDAVNILNASFEAMCMAAARLDPRPELLLVDGNRFRSTLDIRHVCVVGGDGIYACIAAASVLAKTWRDERMRLLSEQFPEYGWARNKGYPTREHRLAIARHGLTPHHRRTFCSDPAGELKFA